MGLKIKTTSFTDFTVVDKDLATLRLEIEDFLVGKFVKDPLTPTLKKLLMDFYMLLLERGTPKPLDSVFDSSDWITHYRAQLVDYSIVHHS